MKRARLARLEKLAARRPEPVDETDLFAALRGDPEGERLLAAWRGHFEEHPGCGFPCDTGAALVHALLVRLGDLTPLPIEARPAWPQEERDR